MTWFNKMCKWFIIWALIHHKKDVGNHLNSFYLWKNNKGQTHLTISQCKFMIWYKWQYDGCKWNCSQDKVLQASQYGTHCCFWLYPLLFYLFVSPLLPTPPVMKMHTKTDFAGAVRELLGIVAAQILTTALQVCVSPHIPISVPLPL